MSEPILFKTIQKQDDYDKQYESFIKYCKGIDESLTNFQVTRENIEEAEGRVGVAFSIVSSLWRAIRDYNLNIQRVIELDSAHKENYGEDSPWLVSVDEYKMRKAELEELRKRFFKHVVRVESEIFDLVIGAHDDVD